MIKSKITKRIILNRAYSNKLETMVKSINIKEMFTRNYINIGRIERKMKTLDKKISKNTIHYLRFLKK